MKLIKPSFSILDDTNYNIESIYKRIELVGRCSHKSEDKITETSAKDFVGRMLNMKHLATCEFGTVYLTIPLMLEDVLSYKVVNYYGTPYTYVNTYTNDKAYITTNYRFLIENNLLSDLEYLSEPTEYHHKRYTVKFVLDRAILAEFTRHRRFSFMAESTRYCNYSKGKFNNELTFIEPCWVDENNLPKETNYTKDDWGSLFYEFYYEATEKGKSEGFNVSPERNFLFSLQASEQLYFSLLKNGWKPEQARNVLPLSLKTELYMCGFAEDWKHFCRLRSKKYGIGNPHPQADELATPLYEEFIKRGYINE